MLIKGKGCLAWHANKSLHEKTLSTLYPPTNLVADPEVQIIQRLITGSKAPNTKKEYLPIIDEWKKIAYDRNYTTLPASKEDISRFIAVKIMEDKPTSFFLKIAPAIQFFHESNGTS